MTTETAVEQKSQTQQIMDLEKEHVLQNYGRYPVAFERGKGSYIYDFDGKRYLDLITGIGVNALGHAHPRMVKVIRDQAGKLIHCSNLYYHEYQGALAQRIAKASGLDRVFFCNSGTEAVEGALKMCRSHGNKIRPEKHEIVAVDNSFHGRTYGALSVTGQEKYRKPFAPVLPGVRFVQINDLEGLEAAINENTAGVILEVIQGEGGIYPISAEWARKARELCDRHDAMLIFDEIQCGVGRTGTYFAYQTFDPPVLPDITVVAKPLAAGLPLGFIAANERAAPTLGSGMHGSTFGGGALACRVAVEFFDMLDELLPQIRARSDYFRAKLAPLPEKYPFVKEIRIHGLMIGIELKMPGKQFVLDALQEGLLINCTHDVVLRMLPPYTITESEIDRGLRILDKVLRKGKQYYKELLKNA